MRSSSAVERLPEGAAFSFDGVAYDWGQVFDAARQAACWAELEREVGQGAALREQGQRADAELVRQEGDGFRRQRSLLAAEELEAWLTARQITVGQWRDHLLRTVLRRLAPLHNASEPRHDELRVTGWCSGAFERFARALAEDLVVADGIDESDKQVARMVELRYLDLIRVDVEVAPFSTVDAAREATLLVREEGMALADVATRAGVTVASSTWYLEDVAPRLRSQLLAGADGELVGPALGDDGASVIRIARKMMPTTADSVVRERARMALREQTVRRRITERVLWHEPLC